MMLHALSLKQPWAYAVIHLGKRFENREWKPGNFNRKFRGTCLLHASRSCTKDDQGDYEDMLWMGGHYPGLIPRPTLLKVPPFANLERGGIVGIMDVTDAVADHDMARRAPDIKNEWFVGPFALVLDRVFPLPFTPCVGQRGFFHVDTNALGLDQAIAAVTKNRVHA
jgi:hypothetical protein